MTLSEQAEEILETLWVEIHEKGKESCDITLLKRDEATKELANNGYVNIVENRIHLTDEGAGEAKGCIRRHRLAERLLVDVLDIKGKFVHETSCNFEHFLHKGLDESICRLLGHPRTCPHGRPVPEGPCCRDIGEKEEKLILPLPELQLNQKAVIAYLQTHDRDALQKIIAMGALPMTEISLFQRFPTLAFRIGRSQFAIDAELASHIHVRRL